MRTKLTAALAVLTLLFGGAAVAVTKGGKLYIKGKNTNVYKEASLSSKVLGTLQPGDEVTWNGADKKMPSMHNVAGRWTGFVSQAALSPTKPTGEVLTNDGAPVSKQAFVSSGAATKALTEAGIKYAGEKPGGKEAAAEVIYFEEHTWNAVKGNAVKDHVRALGLNEGER